MKRIKFVYLAVCIICLFCFGFLGRCQGPEYVPATVEIYGPADGTVLSPDTTSVVITGKVIPGDSDVLYIRAHKNKPQTRHSTLIYTSMPDYGKVEFNRANGEFQCELPIDPDSIYSTCAFEVLDAKLISNIHKVSYSCGESKKEGEGEENAVNVFADNDTVDKIVAFAVPLVNKLLNDWKEDLLYGCDGTHTCDKNSLFHQDSPFMQEDSPLYYDFHPVISDDNFPYSGGINLLFNLGYEVDVDKINLGEIKLEILELENNKVRLKGMISGVTGIDGSLEVTNFGDLHLGLPFEFTAGIPHLTFIMDITLDLANSYDLKIDVDVSDIFHGEPIVYLKGGWQTVIDILDAAINPLICPIECGEECWRCLGKICAVEPICFGICEVDCLFTSHTHLIKNDIIGKEAKEIIKTIIPSLLKGILPNTIHMDDFPVLGVNFSISTMDDNFFRNDGFHLNLNINEELLPKTVPVTDIDRYFATPYDIPPPIPTLGSNIALTVSDDMVNQTLYCYTKAGLINNMDVTKLVEIVLQDLTPEDLTAKVSLTAPPICDFSGNTPTVDDSYFCGHPINPYISEEGEMRLGRIVIPNLIIDLENTLPLPGWNHKARLSIDIDGALKVKIGDNASILVGIDEYDTYINAKVLYENLTNASMLPSVGVNIANRLLTEGWLTELLFKNLLHDLIKGWIDINQFGVDHAELSNNYLVIGLSEK